VPFFVVATKSDLPVSVDLSGVVSSNECIFVSTRTGDGIELLAKNIYNFFVNLPDDPSGNIIAISSVRHYNILFRSIKSLQDFIDNRKSGSFPEFLSLDLRASLSALGEVTGETSTDEILDVIFSSFCVGK